MDPEPASIHETPKMRILRTAHDLFYQNGIRATGIDRIIADSGVAKKTFYRAFASKDELILAFLEYRHEHWMQWFKSVLKQVGAKPAAGLKPLLGAMKIWFASPTFRGCAFLNATTEAANIDGVLEQVRSHKRAVEKVLRPLGQPQFNARQNARAAVIAMDGAILQAQFGDINGALQGLETLILALEPRR